MLRDSRAAARLTQRERTVILRRRADVIAALGDALGKDGEQNHRVAVLFIDLAGASEGEITVSPINEDAVCVNMTERLSKVLRAKDVVGKVREHELIVILPALESDDSLSACIARLVHALAEPLATGSVVHHISARIGISVAPFNGTSGEALLRAADEAMHQAKTKGVSVYYSV